MQWRIQCNNLHDRANQNASGHWRLLLKIYSSSPKFLQECLGLLQVHRIKPLREPAIERRQQVVSLGALALALPQACEAHGGPQLPRLGLLTAGDGESLLQTLLRLP